MVTSSPTGWVGIGVAMLLFLSLVGPASSDFSFPVFSHLRKFAAVTPNRCLFFGGSAYAAFPEGLVTGSKNVTVEMWFRTGRTGILLGVSKDDPSAEEPGEGDAFPLLFVSKDGHLSALVPTTPPPSVVISSPSDVKDSRWHHGALVITPTQIRLYVDGKLQGDTISLTDKEIALKGLVKNTLGLGWSGSPELGDALAGERTWLGLRGQVDDLRIWDVPVPQPQLQAMMNTELSGTEPHLIAYYKMDHGKADNASTLVDFTRHQNNGTIPLLRGVRPYYLMSTAPISRFNPRGNTTLSKEGSEDAPNLEVVPETEVMRIAVLPGQVNMHIVNGVWVPDPDRESTADVNKLQYCKKFYPDTVRVVPYRVETIAGWLNAKVPSASNTTNILRTWRCIQRGTEDDTPPSPVLPFVSPLSVHNAFVSPLTAPIATSSTPTTLEISWTFFDVQNVTVANYTLEIANGPAGPDTEFRPVYTGLELKTLVTGLEPAHEYRCRVIAAVLEGETVSQIISSIQVHRTPEVFPGGDLLEGNFVSFMRGKVNMRTEDGQWVPDEDGKSDYRVNRLAYCRKFYYGIVRVDRYKLETIDGWIDLYNKSAGPQTSTQWSFRCVSGDMESFAKPIPPRAPFISKTTIDLVWQPFELTTPVNYTLEGGVMDTGSIVDTLYTGPLLRYTVTGLKPGTNYRFRVGAIVRKNRTEADEEEGEDEEGLEGEEVHLLSLKYKTLTTYSDFAVHKTLGSASLSTPKNSRITISVSDGFDLFVDGDPIGSSAVSSQGRFATNPVSYMVDLFENSTIAVKGYNLQGQGGILLMVTGQYKVVSNPRTWKCTSRLDENETDNGYDDLHWAKAVSYGFNGNALWGFKPQISKDAEWIWTEDNESRNPVVCRFSLNQGSGILQHGKPNDPDEGFVCFGDTEGPVCSGHGVCVGTDQCRCFTGWNGTHCDECVSEILCGGHGLCDKNFGGQCSCNPGWTGPRCMTCDGKVMCNGRGTCTPDGTCSCFEGYSGLRCEVADNDLICTKHGVANQNGLGCQCEFGWSGTQCGLCDPLALCSGHGSCTPDGACNCDDGFTGDKCQKCDPDILCGGHGSCTSDGDCECFAGWLGTACNACDPQVMCNGKGTCGPAGKCKCDAGFQGDRCEYTLHVSGVKHDEGTTSIMGRAADVIIGISAGIMATLLIALIIIKALGIGSATWRGYQRVGDGGIGGGRGGRGTQALDTLFHRRDVEGQTSLLRHRGEGDPGEHEV